MGLGKLVGNVLDFCYPAACAVCREPCASGLLCTKCEESQQKLECQPACDHCAKPLAEWLAPCPWCMGKGIRPFGRIAALGVFDDPLKDLIHQMKYQHRWSLGEDLAERLLALDRVQEILAGAQTIVSVPLYRWRQVKRGYNQSEVIARHLARNFRPKLTFARPLRRIRATQTQTDLHSREARLENVRGAFRLARAAAVRDRHVVLIDDVLTTGATLQAAGRALMEAQPASLQAIVLAVADPRHRGFEAI